MTEPVAAGRELDRLVEERVFGGKVTQEVDDLIAEFPPPDSVPPDAPFITVQIYEVPEYSTDIGAAWCVVQRMRELGLYVEIHDKSDVGWDVLFWRTPHPGSTSWQFVSSSLADTASEAICIAALAAMDSLPSKAAALT